MLASLLDLQGCVPETEMVTQLVTGFEEEGIPGCPCGMTRWAVSATSIVAHGPAVSSLRFPGAKPMCSTRRQR